jgi:FecR protein
MTKPTNNPENEMPNDYLWDHSGTPDPESQRLESLLSEFRHIERPFASPVNALPTNTRLAPASLPASATNTWLPRLAAAAVIILAGAVGIFFFFRPTTQPETGLAWGVANLEGAPRIGSRSISPNQPSAKLYVGQTLTTNSSSRATLTENDLGEIQIDPDSRVRLLQTDPNHKRLQLDVGTIHAAIWAPPGQFVVDTPSAVAIDLGCAYTLHVTPDGSGTVRTTLGWVGFHLQGRDSFIPAGAMCSTRPKLGPGTPYFEDAPASFIAALHTFDQSPQSSDAASTALATILSQARPRDTFTLWHLLSRTDNSDREKVYARLATFVPPPAGVTRVGILALDFHMLDLYWNALDLGDISIWRLFEQSADPQAKPAPQLTFLRNNSY